VRQRHPNQDFWEPQWFKILEKNTILLLCNGDIIINISQGRVIKTGMYPPIAVSRFGKMGFGPEIKYSRIRRLFLIEVSQNLSELFQIIQIYSSD
jgi:hypothetical protein